MGSHRVKPEDTEILKPIGVSIEELRKLPIPEAVRRLSNLADGGEAETEASFMAHDAVQKQKEGNYDKI